MSQQDLADKTGYTSRSSIAKIEAGERDIPQSKIVAFAEALGTTPAYLMGWTDEESANPLPPGLRPIGKGSYIPLYGRIACGSPILAVEDLEETAWMPDDIKADFALSCCGDSMINARIFDGDIVYIRAQPQVENGEIAAVIIDDDTVTLKKVYTYKDKIILEAANPAYDDIVRRGEEMNHVRILGKAVAFVSLID